MNDIFENGRKLPLIQEFYTIQGEGYHTGKAAYFIRIGGCDIGCSWCDTKVSWNTDSHTLASTKGIIEKAYLSEAKSIVVTGGEPLSYDLNYLIRKAKEKNLQTFLETSGAYELSGEWDWVCLSPKKQKPPLADIYSKADELKMIIFKNEDLLWAEECSKKVSENCKLYLQPEWSNREENTLRIIEYVKKNPKWNLSVQLHKYLHIP
ncbi:MAG: 7-carboxy-7-deazaguanine synthase QueE [Bacteroidales bacterium]|nr:7-carboxy-7-deazaguanine synthase QueE [Bacteroidales bacterium]